MSFQDLFAELVVPVETQEAHPPYSSLETVWRALQDWGFVVDEYAKLQFFPDEYKAWLKGQLSEKSPGQQEFLRTMFEVKFPGSRANPRILIHFQVRREMS